MASTSSSSGRRAIWVIAIAALVVAAFLGWRRTRKPPAAEIRQALWQQIVPVALRNCALKRFGSANDGGYLMCENLLSGVQSAYSYGIDTEDNWGCEVSRRLGVAIHQYDCFTPHRPVCEGGKF